MAGLFYYDDVDGITLFWFSPDGKVVAMFKSTKYDQHLKTFPWFRVESDKIHFSRGFYRVDMWDNIGIVIRNEHGRIVYKGHKRDDGTIDLYHRCPITNFKKIATYVRYSEEHHIIHFELDQSILN